MNGPFSFEKIERAAGILMHITSLPSGFGIGDFGPQARAFAQFLYNSKQSFWQLLPLNPTANGAGHSPYSSYSAFAGNPLLISPELLVEEGLLEEKDLLPFRIQDTNEVLFDTTEKNKYSLLEKAFENFQKGSSSSFRNFCEQQDYWLNDHALYSVLKKQHDNKAWYDWPEAYKARDKKALEEFAAQHEQVMEEVKWRQFIFSEQWHKLKTYCAELNIHLFGDLPFYVAYDSVDVWANREIFNLHASGNMMSVSGVPPDAFNDDGQLWGMPVFRWDELKKRNYDWWIKRLAKNLELFDVVRLDHFRAFSSYWDIDAGKKSAKEGKWIKGPAHDFFNTLLKEFGALPFVAEDLGEIDDDVYTLRDDFKLPGMNVLHFAFGEDMPENNYIPHHHRKQSLVYTGTHDNNTTVGWFRSLSTVELNNLCRYTGTVVTEKNVCDVMMRLAYGSVSRLAVVPMQDVLCLDERSRMNMPASEERNWIWRMTPGQYDIELEELLKNWCLTYDRH
jgi:4-alpha-glucanotransferase